MTLRARILLLFVGFALIPAALLGAGDYAQSMNALRLVLDSRSEVLAGQVRGELSNAWTRAQLDVEGVAHLLSETNEPVTSDALTEVLSEQSDLLAGLRIERAGQAPVTAARPPLEEPCTADGDELAIRARVPGTDGAEVLVGTVSPARLVERAPSLRSRMGPSGRTEIVDPSGRIVYPHDCGSVGASVPEPVLGTLRSNASRYGFKHVRYEAASGNIEADWTATVAPTDLGGYAVVVHASEDDFLTPFRESRTEYLAVVLGVILLAALIFGLAASRQFRALRSLTAAADQIEVGNLRPWLPPPGNDEVGRLSFAFRNMVERLSESIRQVEVTNKMASVGELASYLSHEIRNPLSSIRLSLQSLHRDLKGGFIPSDADRIIAIATNEVKRLDGVVRTVLEIGRPRDDDDDSYCSAHETMQESLNVLAPKLRAQGLEVEFVARAERDLVKGSAEGLRSVWINLLVNAVDALQDTEHGRIRVSTSLSDDGKRCHVRIADNGPGVPPDLVDTIFQPFFTTKMRGNGIGLPTALKSVEQAGGTISYEPVAAGTGAVFVVKLIVAQLEEQPPEPETETTQREPSFA
ncbi:MAG: sensor histidine kinase [Candidatus Longimicrobiales bacterium M2_2A_002]